MRNNHIYSSHCHFLDQPENIVLTDLRSKRIKIIDFGTAVEISPNQQQKAMEGTPDFVLQKLLIMTIFISIQVSMNVYQPHWIHFYML